MSTFTKALLRDTLSATTLAIDGERRPRYSQISSGSHTTTDTHQVSLTAAARDRAKNDAREREIRPRNAPTPKKPKMAAVRKAWLELPDEPAVGWRVVDVVAEDGAFVSIKDGAASTRVDRARLSDYDATYEDCLLYTSPSPRDQRGSRMPSSA